MHGALRVKKKNFMRHGIYCFYHYKTLFWGVFWALVGKNWTNEIPPP